ncbi:MAG: antitoxin [Verrucomicrobia bacterium]|nr:MAG: antitoxin [Verrucomicrobiota bacterium]
MNRISIDVTDNEHKRLKAKAALRRQFIKDFVLERKSGTGEAYSAALHELEVLRDNRIRAACAGSISRRTASEIFSLAARKRST